MKKKLVLLCCLSCFLLSCGDDSPLDQLTGEHLGTYVQRSCALQQEILVTAPGSSLTITENSETSIDLVLNKVENDVSEQVFAFSASMLTDSVYNVSFEQDDFEYTGRVNLTEAGKVELYLSNGCNFINTLITTESFVED